MTFQKENLGSMDNLARLTCKSKWSCKIENCPQVAFLNIVKTKVLTIDC